MPSRRSIMEVRRRQTAMPVEQCTGWTQAQNDLPADPNGNRYQRRKYKKQKGKR
jgi:hypothetical protein